MFDHEWMNEFALGLYYSSFVWSKIQNNPSLSQVGHRCSEMVDIIHIKKLKTTPVHEKQIQADEYPQSFNTYYYI